MYAELYQYFIQHRSLPVPGIGTFLLTRKPAYSDFPNRLIHAPGFEVSLSPGVQPFSRNFFTWLGSLLHISERDAVIRYNEFVYGIRQQVNEGDQIHWKGVGTLNKGIAGEIRFVPDVLPTPGPVSAKKLVREKAEHMVRVGEEERTSAEMETLLTREESRRSYWWVYAAAIALLSVMFIGWYFSEHGVQVSTSANTIKGAPGEAGPPSRILP